MLLTLGTDLQPLGEFDMTAPILKKAGLTLKTVGVSHIWLSGSGIAIGNPVKVKRHKTTEVVWEGNVDKQKGTGFRAKLQFSKDADYFSRGKSPKGPGDLVDVDVTVTNAGGEESSPDVGVVIIDGPE